MAHVIPELLKRANEAEEGSSFEVYSVDHRRTFCFIEDAVAMLGAAALSQECEGEVLNVGVEAPEIRIGDLAGMVAETVGKRLQVAPLPATAGSPLPRYQQDPPLDRRQSPRLLGGGPGADLHLVSVDIRRAEGFRCERGRRAHLDLRVRGEQVEDLQVGAPPRDVAPSTAPLGVLVPVQSGDAARSLQLVHEVRDAGDGRLRRDPGVRKQGSIHRESRYLRAGDR